MKLILFLSTISQTLAWLPDHTIRGVNLGSHLVFEPWISNTTWTNLGCDGQNSEFDCVLSLGQETADENFASHWGSWITRDDIVQMREYGINTVRIPVGYWIKEDLVYSDSEHFPHGGLQYLEDVCGWASEQGLYIIVDLHGAPGAQEAHQPFTGQYASTPGFYQDYQYERALNFLEWMTSTIHQTDSFRNVGMIELVNEPLQNTDEVSSMRTGYYPDAFTRIRTMESSLGITENNYLHIQMMNEKWGSGDRGRRRIAVNQDSYIAASCNDDRGGNTPTIVGEFSLSVPDNVQWNAEWDPATNVDFYKRWFAAQVVAYEKQASWVFWTWKADLGDYRWSYKDAVEAGVIPSDLDGVYDNSPC
ncbi:glycoside hydrolase superfamily [Aspergillus californicus]